MTMFKHDDGAPNPSLFKAYVKSSAANIWKALQQAIGANGARPFIAGKRVTATLAFGEAATQDSEDLTIPCTGAKVGDQCILGGPVPAAGSCYSAFVSEADVVTVRYNNYSGAGIDPATAVFTVTVIPNS